jgi:hypothetical protein
MQNRLLYQIRTQQAQNQALSQGHAIDDSTPTSERSTSSSFPNPPSGASLGGATPGSASFVARARSPTPHQHRTSADIARRSRAGSRTSSLGASPNLLAHAGQGTEAIPSADWNLSHSSRDESAFYQAETSNLARENQMLKFRIRELERQMAELSTTSSSTHRPPLGSPRDSQVHSPSNLINPPISADASPVQSEPISQAPPEII